MKLDSSKINIEVMAIIKRHNVFYYPSGKNQYEIPYNACYGWQDAGFDEYSLSIFGGVSTINSLCFSEYFSVIPYPNKKIIKCPKDSINFNKLKLKTWYKLFPINHSNCYNPPIFFKLSDYKNENNYSWSTYNNFNENQTFHLPCSLIVPLSDLDDKVIKLSKVS